MAALDAERYLEGLHDSDAPEVAAAHAS